MKYILLCFVGLELFFSTTIICLSRIFIKDYKAGMMIYLFSNIINVFIASSRIKEKVYFDTHILLLCFCFTISTLLYLMSFYMDVSSVTFSNYYSLRVVMVSFISSYFLNKRYTTMQLNGKILVVVGVAIQFFADKNYSIQPYVLTSIGSGFFNALSAVIFEAKIKNNIKNIFSYIFTYSFAYIPYNTIASIIEYKKYQYNFLFTHWIFYTLILLNIFSGYMSLYLSMSCDSFERTIISNGCGLLSSLLSDLILLRTCGLLPLLGFVFVFIGTYLYVNNKQEELKELIVEKQEV